jgi:hypothetical protein
MGGGKSRKTGSVSLKLIRKIKGDKNCSNKKFNDEKMPNLGFDNDKNESVSEDIKRK